MFFIDTDNPKLADMTVEQIADELICPTCGRPLRTTLHPYPQTFRTDDGQIGHFDPGSHYPPDSQSFIKEFWEIE